MTSSDLHIRPLQPEDVTSVAVILERSPDAAQWDAAECLRYISFVAEIDGHVAGILTARSLPADETEILNLAVDPVYRRRGAARRLIRHFFLFFPGTCFLEVRESNAAAIQLYESIGFSRISKRPRYYTNPPEAAIVLRR